MTGLKSLSHDATTHDAVGKEEASFMLRETPTNVFSQVTQWQSCLEGGNEVRVLQSSSNSDTNGEVNPDSRTVILGALESSMSTL